MFSIISILNEFIFTIIILQFLIVEMFKLNKRDFNVYFFNKNAYYSEFLRFNNISNKYFKISNSVLSELDLSKILFIMTLFTLIISLFNVGLSLEIYDNIFLNVILYIYLIICIVVCIYLHKALVMDAINVFHFYPIFLVAVLAGYELLSSINGSLLQLYCSLELLSFAVYILISTQNFFYFSGSQNAESGLKAFIFSSIFSSFILLGTLVLYANYGTIDITELAVMNFVTVTIVKKTLQLFLYAFGFFLIIFTFFFKIGFMPFQVIVAEMYEGSSIAISVFLLLVPKFVYCILLFVFSSFVLISVNSFRIFFILFTVFTIFYVSLFGFHQAKLKRFFIYISSIPLSLLLISCSQLIYQSAVTSFSLICFYIFFSLILWGWLLSFYCNKYEMENMMFNKVSRAPRLIRDKKTKQFLYSDFKLYYHTNYLSLLDNTLAKQEKNSMFVVKNDKISEYETYFISDLTGLYKKNPLMAIVLLIVLFSFAGIPPFFFFFLKSSIIFTPIQSDSDFISVVLLILSLFSIAYYIKIVKIIVFDKLNSAFAFIFRGWHLRSFQGTYTDRADFILLIVFSFLIFLLMVLYYYNTFFLFLEFLFL